MLKDVGAELLKFRRKEVGEYGINQPPITDVSAVKETAESTLKLGKRIVLSLNGLQDDVTTLKKQAEEHENETLRRVSEELYEVKKELGQAVDVAMELCDILHGAHSFAQLQGAPVWVDALTQALDKSEQLISSIGLSYIKAHGEKFDTRIHNCVDVLASPAGPQEMVVDVYRRGYRYKGRVRRCADVKVSK